MSDTNGHSPNTSGFDLLAEQIEVLHAHATDKANRLRALLAEADGEAKRLERMLNIARPTEAAAPKKVQPKRSRRSRISDENKDRIVAFMATHDPSPERGFMAEDIAAALGISTSSIGYGLLDLRDEERVRLIGKAPQVPGRMGQRPNLYAVMPNG